MCQIFVDPAVCSVGQHNILNLLVWFSNKTAVIKSKSASLFWKVCNWKHVGLWNSWITLHIKQIWPLWSKVEPPKFFCIVSTFCWHVPSHGLCSVSAAVHEPCERSLGCAFYNWLSWRKILSVYCACAVQLRPLSLGPLCCRQKYPECPESGLTLKHLPVMVYCCPLVRGCTSKLNSIVSFLHAICMFIVFVDKSWVLLMSFGAMKAVHCQRFQCKSKVS